MVFVDEHSGRVSYLVGDGFSMAILLFETVSVVVVVLVLGRRWIVLVHSVAPRRTIHHIRL